jgi:hypothetical protein
VFAVFPATFYAMGPAAIRVIEPGEAELVLTEPVSARLLDWDGRAGRHWLCGLALAFAWERLEANERAAERGDEQTGSSSASK